jgi:hypothetical protein
MFNPISREQRANARRIVAEERRREKETAKEVAEKGPEKGHLKDGCKEMFHKALQEKVTPTLWRKCQEQVALDQARGSYVAKKCVIYGYLRGFEKEDNCVKYFGEDSTVTGLPPGSTFDRWVRDYDYGDSYDYSFNAHLNVQ